MKRIWLTLIFLAVMILGYLVISGNETPGKPSPSHSDGGGDGIVLK